MAKNKKKDGRKVGFREALERMGFAKPEAKLRGKLKVRVRRPLPASRQKEVDYELVLKAHQSDVSGMKELLEQGGNPNAEDDEGWKLVHISAAFNDVKALRLLHSFGADLNSKRRNVESTPAHTAAEQGNLEALQFLYKRGAIMNARDKGGITPQGLAELNRKNRAASFLLNLELKKLKKK